MKERPILFSAPMIQAILDGRKNMTRRVVKKIYPEKEPSRHFSPGPCPHGQPGDRLWVREAWRVGSWREDDGQIAVDYKAGPICRTKWLTVPDPDKFNDLWEGSTQEAEAAYGIKERYKWKPGESPCRWRPSLFMPRWASRITLEITAVRVERVQDISADDAWAEGFGIYDLPNAPIASYYGAVAKFHNTWNSLNLKRGYGWDANPFVWTITFKRLP